MDKPFVSVVTPFFNTAPYLAECIESVLAQTYPRLEYILSDNCSTDGSTEIAESYARKDARIHLIRQPQVLGQVQHYNRALSELSETSEYCKIVQADDLIFPDCLRLMVTAFEQSQTIGLVSSYDLKGNAVRGSGVPYPRSLLAGHEAARLYLRDRVYPFGSPTTVMYRSSLVRSCQPFYDESLLHEDTEKCMQILQEWDFGFVHQVLSFMRTDNVNSSISAKVRSFDPDALDRYIIVKRYSPVFLESNEAQTVTRQSREEYYRILARGVLRVRQSGFWQYHVGGLRTLGERLDLCWLTVQISRELLRITMNPGGTLSRALRRHRRGADQRNPARELLHTSSNKEPRSPL
jgi:glycosyltransferase involved in cell wall biosynthesis